MSRLLARHTGRHVRRHLPLGNGSSFGWSGLAAAVPAAVERFTRRRPQPPAVEPVGDLIPFRDHPYVRSSQ